MYHILIYTCCIGDNNLCIHTQPLINKKQESQGHKTYIGNVLLVQEDDIQNNWKLITGYTLFWRRINYVRSNRIINLFQHYLKQIG